MPNPIKAADTATPKAQELKPSGPSPDTKQRSIVALVATLFLPGLGHALRGHAKRGVYFLLALCGIWVVFVGLSAWWMAAVPGAFLATLAWLAVCAFDAYRLEKQEQKNKAWFVFAAAAGVTWLIAPVVLSAVVRAVSVEAFKVPGGSMCPTLVVGDHMLVDKTAYRGATPARGEVVVYRNEKDVAFVHRVVAVAGQDVEVDTQGRVRVNGEAAQLQPATHAACDSALTHTEVLGTTHEVILGNSPGLSAKLRVPADHVFVLGDNRPNAADSRMVGTVSVDSVKGRAFRRYLHDGSPTFSKIE